MDNIKPTGKESVITDFYPDWKDVPWSENLNGTEKLEIIVSYWSGWVEEYHHELRAIFEHGGQVTIVLPSPASEAALSGTLKMFPEADVKQKIEKTVARLFNIYAASSDNSELSVHYYPDRLNYAAVRFDNTHLFHGFYEQFRRGKVNSWAVFFDLTQSAHMRSFYDKEFHEFYKSSQALSEHEIELLANRHH